MSLSAAIPDSLPTFSDGSAISIQSLLVKAKHLTPMPAVVIKLLDVLGDPRVDANRVTRILERDQAIAAATVRLANSSLHRGRAPITTLQMAVARVGLAGIRDIVLAASVLKTPRRSVDVVDDVRKHMFRSACCARVVGQAVPRLNPDTAFLTGLMLDVGRSLLGLAVPEDYEKVMRSVRFEGKDLAETERTWLGFTHAEVGYELATQWGFPASIVNCIRYQHDLEGALDNASVEEGWYTAAGILADDLATTLFGEPMSVEDIRKHPTQASLRMPDEAIDALVQNCKKTVDELAPVFDL